MLEMAEVGFLTTEAVDRQLPGLNLNERRLIQSYRLMTEQERRQIQRLIEQLVDRQVE